MEKVEKDLLKIFIESEIKNLILCKRLRIGKMLVLLRKIFLLYNSKDFCLKFEGKNYFM